MSQSGSRTYRCACIEISAVSGVRDPLLNVAQWDEETQVGAERVVVFLVLEARRSQVVRDDVQVQVSEVGLYIRVSCSFLTARTVDKRLHSPHRRDRVKPDVDTPLKPLRLVHLVAHHLDHFVRGRSHGVDDGTARRVAQQRSQRVEVAL